MDIQQVYNLCFSGQNKRFVKIRKGDSIAHWEAVWVLKRKIKHGRAVGNVVVRSCRFHWKGKFKWKLQDVEEQTMWTEGGSGFCMQKNKQEQIDLRWASVTYSRTSPEVTGIGMAWASIIKSQVQSSYGCTDGSQSIRKQCILPDRDADARQSGSKGVVRYGHILILKVEPTCFLDEWWRRKSEDNHKAF